MEQHLVKGYEPSDHNKPLEGSKPEYAVDNGSPGYTCELCRNIEKGGIEYGFGNQNKDDGSCVKVCRPCHDKINDDWKALGAIRYDEFDKYNSVAKKYPKIYVLNFYKLPHIRKRLNLKDI